jgi:hypothetical protein
LREVAAMIGMEDELDEGYTLEDSPHHAEQQARGESRSALRLTNEQRLATTRLSSCSYGGSRDEDSQEHERLL